MLIDIKISEWEQACCGEEIKVGEERAFTVHAAEPDLPSEDTGHGHKRSLYIEERHSLTPPEVEKVKVVGVVREIKGVNYPHTQIPGSPRGTKVDEDLPATYTELGEVRARGTGFDSFLVTLAVPDETLLPDYDPRAFGWRDREAQRAEVGKLRMVDNVGQLLEETADYTESQYGEVAEILRDPNRSAVTVRPNVEGAATVAWSRSDEEADYINVSIDSETGRGFFQFPTTQFGVEMPKYFLNASARGGVFEEVTESEEGKLRRDLVVEFREERGPDSVFVDRFESGPLERDDGTKFFINDDGRRGRFQYAPWDDSLTR